MDVPMAQLLRSQSSGGATMTPAYQIGKDQYLGNHHPIGFNYDAVAADPGIRSADTAMLTPTTLSAIICWGRGIR